MTSSPQPAIPGEEHSPALALVNSRHGHRTGPVEHLSRPDEALRWLAGRNLVDDEEAVAMTEVDVVGLHKLREAIREVLVARIEGRAPAADAVQEVNATASSAPVTPTLHWSMPGRPSRTWTPAPGSSGLDQARAKIAADVIDLLCGDRAHALYACGGPRCVRLFLRDHPRRRWCSSRCGERIRARRYYDRHRSSADE